MDTLAVTAPADPSSGLTQRQAELVRALVAYFKEHQRWPAYRELSVLMGCKGSHPSSMKYNLERLQAKGVLVGDGAVRPRCYRLAGLEWQPRFTDTPEGERLRKILGD